MHLLSSVARRSLPVLLVVVGISASPGPGSIPSQKQSDTESTGSGKIYSIVLSTIEDIRAAGITAANAPQMNVLKNFNSNLTQFDERGRFGLLLDVTDVSAGLVVRLGEIGGAVVHALPEARLVAVYLPIDRIDEAASIPEVRIVRPITRGVSSTGSVTSEGDSIHHAVNVRTGLSVKGDSVNVGVISDGCVTWPVSQASGDLPATFAAANFTFLNGNKSGTAGDEGTAMMEIVHDIAPNSDLYFYGAGSIAGGSATMIDAIQRLVREKGCDIVVDDLTYFDQPMFEDATPATAGTIAAFARWANDTGVVYVSSAGNWAKGGSTDRSHYQSNYRDHDPVSNVSAKPLPDTIPPPGGGLYPPPFDNLHDFDPGPGVDIGLMVVMPGFDGIGEPPELDIILEWNDPWSLSPNDFDLYLYDISFTNSVASSVTVQGGAQNPYESIAIWNTDPEPDTFMVVINLFAPPIVLPQLLGLYIYGCSWVEYNTPENSIWGQPGVPEVIAVGAVPYNNISTNEVFSSRGNYDVYFPVYSSRPKPDVMAIDGGVITGTGPFGSFNPPFWRFYGTSASAPHVAGMAALLLSDSPALTTAQVHAKFERTAVDLGSAGFDATFGYGRADIEIAMKEVDTTIVASSGPYSENHTPGLPMFFSTTDGYAVDRVLVTGGVSMPTQVQTTLAVTSGNPYDDAGVTDLECPTVKRWYNLAQSGGTNGQFDATVTAYIAESERSAAGIPDSNLQILHWNGSFFDVFSTAVFPERFGDTWEVTSNIPNASFSPYFVGYLTRGVAVTGLSGNSGDPDSTKNVEFSIQNTGNGWDSVHCAITDTRGWTLSPTDSSFSLVGPVSESFEFLVTIGGTDTVGTLDTVWLMAHSVTDTTLVDSAFVVVEVSGGTTEVSVEVSGGWNMVSVPVEAKDMAKMTLYPTAISNAFAYAGGYQIEDTLEIGHGYWMKFDSTESVPIEGYELEEDTVSVVKGWNIIGSISSPVTVANITEIPSSIVISNYFGYNTAYFNADTLKPGFAYWVKISSTGQLVLSK